ARRLCLPRRCVLALRRLVARLAIVTLTVATAFVRRLVAMLVPPAITITSVPGRAIAIARVTRFAPVPLVTFVPRALCRKRGRLGGDDLACTAEEEAPQLDEDADLLDRFGPRRRDRRLGGDRRRRRNAGDSGCDHGWGRAGRAIF